MITVEIAMMHHQKLTELDPTSYTPLALVNLDPAGFQVRADSPYKTMADALAAIKANPGQVQGLGHRAGRHLAPGAGRLAARRQGRPGHGALGAVATAPRRACRTWSPAASSSCRVRCPRRAR